jgi:hypothetical protein
VEEGGQPEGASKNTKRDGRNESVHADKAPDGVSQEIVHEQRKFQTALQQPGLEL